MVAITVEYRVSSRHPVKVEDCIEDAKSAMRWVRAHAGKLGIDTNRIAASGGSAGGHLAACTAVIEDFNATTDPPKVSSRPNAMVLFNSAVGLAPDDPRKNEFACKGRVRTSVEQCFPLTYASKRQSSCIMFFGTEDRLARMAAEHGVTVLLEPFFRGFLASAKRTRLFLEEVDSPHMRVLLDPANLLELNDLEEMFDQLTPWIDCLHAKDRRLHVDQGVPAGQGSLDYAGFVSLAAQQVPHAPMILEYVGPNNYQQALRHLRNTMQNAGVAEKKTLV